MKLKLINIFIRKFAGFDVKLPLFYILRRWPLWPRLCLDEVLSFSPYAYVVEVDFLPSTSQGQQLWISSFLKNHFGLDWSLARYSVCHISRNLDSSCIRNQLIKISLHHRQLNPRHKSTGNSETQTSTLIEESAPVKRANACWN